MLTADQIKKVEDFRYCWGAGFNPNAEKCQTKPKKKNNTDRKVFRGKDNGDDIVITRPKQQES